MREMNYFYELLNFIPIAKSKNMLVLDIDNTLLKTRTFLGSDQWYSWQSQLIRTKHESAIARSQKELNIITNHLYSYLNYDLCDSEAPDILSKFCQNKFDIILLTARGDTAQQHLLNSLKILNISPYLCNTFSSLKYSGSVLKDGIIYCNGGDKGDILKSFFDQNNYYPKQLIFVDDKLKNLQCVQKSIPQAHVFLFTNQQDNIELFNQSDKQGVTNEYNYYLKKHHIGF